MTKKQIIAALAEVMAAQDTWVDAVLKASNSGDFEGPEPQYVKDARHRLRQAQHTARYIIDNGGK